MSAVATTPAAAVRETTSVLDWAAPFEALAAGAQFVSRGRTVTETDVVQFAALTGDYHPLHTDAHFASAGPFGERVAHGMLTISYAVGLVPLDPRRVLALRRIGDVVFKRPVRLGETIHVEGSVTGLSRVAEDAGLVSFSWRIKDAAGTLLTRATVDVLWAAGDGADPDLDAEASLADAVPEAALGGCGTTARRPDRAATPADRAAARRTRGRLALGDDLHPAGAYCPVPL